MTSAAAGAFIPLKQTKIKRQEDLTIWEEKLVFLDDYAVRKNISKSFTKSEAKNVPRTDRLNSSRVFLVSKHPSWRSVIMFGNEEKTLEISLV